MSFVSYAQNFEDVMLWRALKHVENGFYIDIGAQHPVVDSVSLAFYEHGWRGVHVEPTQQYSNLLRAARPDESVFQLAIGNQNKRLTFFEFEDTGLSTADAEVARTHQANGFKCRETLVPFLSLDALLQQVGARDIHWLKVDVEGLEKEVLESWESSSSLPWIVVVESTRPRSQERTHQNWEFLLFGKGYSYVYFDGLNQFYISPDHPELARAFDSPPNVFDEFFLAETQFSCSLVSSRAQQAEARAKVAEDRAQQAEAESQAADAVSRAVAAEAHINALVNSTSWRATKPLRVIALGLRNPSEFKLKLQQRAALKERALYWKRNAMTRIGNLRPDGVLFKILRPLGYERINFGAISVFFSRAALEDNRGIGRVSRELFQGLRSLAVSGQVNAAQGSKDVYFYSSIHWCPDVLPSGSVVMIHDVIPLIFEEHYPDAYLWKGKYKTIAQQADLIVTISESSADDISKYLEVPRERIRVVYNGVTQLPVAETVGFELPAVPFVTYLGAYDWHKNLSVVLKAMQLHDGFDLVMIGNNQNCRVEATHLGISDRVHFLGSLGDAEVGYVLSKSLALVFPSRYEGFGLPPFEAAFLGIPSICSSRPAMTEVLQGAAIFVDPESPEDWGRAICRLLNDGGLRRDLSLGAKEISGRYSWANSLAALIDVLNKI